MDDQDTNTLRKCSLLILLVHEPNYIFTEGIRILIMIQLILSLFSVDTNQNNISVTISSYRKATGPVIH